MSKFRKKKAAEEVKEDEIITANEVVIEAVDEIPEDAEVVDEVIIEPKEEKPAKKKKEEKIEEVKEVEPLKADDLVILIKKEDYSGNPVEDAKVYRIGSICADKVQLKYKGLKDICAKLDNLTKVGK